MLFVLYFWVLMDPAPVTSARLRVNVNFFNLTYSLMELFHSLGYTRLTR